PLISLGCTVIAGAVQPALDKTEISITVLRPKVQKNRECPRVRRMRDGNAGGIRQGIRPGPSPGIQCRRSAGCLSKFTAIPKTFKHPSPDRQDGSTHRSAILMYLGMKITSVRSFLLSCPLPEPLKLDF